MLVGWVVVVIGEVDLGVWLGVWVPGVLVTSVVSWVCV